MSYLVLARKYRPQNFTSVTGQEHVTRTLRNAIKRNKVGHAYLFAGPRGVGKTSIARVFSKALNCVNGPTADPCDKCTNCEAITKGTALAVREIDGASHNSVDNVRDLIESFRSLPAPGYRYKIYIIDEVHMLSTSAFNALLKSLEEPPPNTVFILATTEVHKIPETVISRCQRYDLRALGAEEIETRLRLVVDQEKIDIEPAVIRVIARLADGSMRDGQSLLDRVQSFSDGKITFEEAGQVLGVADRGILFSIASAIIGRDAGKALSELDRILSQGADIALLLKDLVFYWRELLILKFGGQAALKGSGISDDEFTDLKRQAEAVSKDDLQDLVEIIRSGADTALRSAFPRYALEALLIRAATRERIEDLGKVIADLRAGIGRAAVKPSAPVVESHERPAHKSAVRTAAATKTHSAPVQHKTESPAAPLDTSDVAWPDFVMACTDGGARMMAEQLKRLSILKFIKGDLEAKGPDLSFKYFDDKANRKRLEDALHKFSGISNWRIRIEALSEGEPPAASMVYQEEQGKIRAKKEKEDAITSHPKIKSLQRVFPGSKVEERN